MKRKRTTFYIVGCNDPDFPKRVVVSYFNQSEYKGTIGKLSKFGLFWLRLLPKYRKQLK
jgi:hypothetical protein